MTAQNKALTTSDISTQVKEWAPGLKDFALVEFNQQNFFKSAIMAITENSQLMECMKTPSGRESMYNAMKRAFSTGLSLNPQEGKAAIIAFSGKASYQIMKEGAVEIVMRSGDIKELMVEIVYQADEFKITKSNSGDKFEFSPARRDRGNVDGYFCAITDKDNISHVKYMTHDECLEIRDAHSAMFNAESSRKKSPWFKAEKGMCKKTVIKAAIRDLRLSPSAIAQFSSEDISEFQDNAKPEPKDVTPITGTTADDVTKKLNKKTPEPVKQQERPTQEKKPAPF